MTEQERIARLEEDLRRSAERERELSARLDDFSRRLDELAEEKADSVFAEGDVADGENGDVEPLFEMPDSVNAAQARFFVSPDEVLTQGAGVKRKSLSLTPETDGGMQIHEFDDAPKAGVLKVMRKRSSNKLVLADPDEKCGRRKWMVPLRREDGDKEIKWVILGEDSDSDSDSDSDDDLEDAYVVPSVDPPCPPTISAAFGTGADEGYVVLTIQNYRRVNGECEPDGPAQVTRIPINQFELDCEAVRACLSGGSGSTTGMQQVEVLTGFDPTTLVFSTAVLNYYGAAPVAGNPIQFPTTTCEES